MSEDQKELILQCVRGERKAQFQLYKLYSRQMFSICMRMLSQRDEAEDALQDAFVAAFKSIEQFKHESTFGAWLKRIVVNKFINAANRKNRSMWISIDNDSMDIAEDAAEEPLSIEPEQLNDAVKNLPEGCRKSGTTLKLLDDIPAGFSRIIDGGTYAVCAAVGKCNLNAHTGPA